MTFTPSVSSSPTTSSSIQQACSSESIVDFRGERRRVGLFAADDSVDSMRVELLVPPNTEIPSEITLRNADGTDRQFSHINATPSSPRYQLGITWNMVGVTLMIVGVVWIAMGYAEKPAYCGRLF